MKSVSQQLDERDAMASRHRSIRNEVMAMVYLAIALVAGWFGYDHAILLLIPSGVHTLFALVHEWRAWRFDVSAATVHEAED